MSKKEERAFFSQLIRVMKHIIKWFTEPVKRSKSWSKSIQNGRIELRVMHKKNPRFNKNYVSQKWGTAFDKATKEAEKEMQQKSSVDQLTEKQVFEDQYDLNNFNKK